MPLETLTSVVTPALSLDLVDLDTVKDELGITDTTQDDFLARAISQVSRAMASYCNRVLVKEQVTDTIYSRLGRDQLVLSRFPVIDVTAATVADGTGGQTTLIEDTDFAVDKERGWLIRLGSSGVPTSWYSSPTTVTYEAGYETIPDDLQQAATRMVTARFHGKGRDPTLRSRSQPGLGDETYWIGAIPGTTGPFPDDVLAILDSYRVPVA